MELKEIDFRNIDSDLYKKSIIYGAGHNGRIIYELLDDLGVPIEAFYDDDVTRWGETYCGEKILSQKQFELLDRNSSNIIISSIYTEKMAHKLERYGFKKVYTALDKLLEVASGHLKFSEYQGNQAYLEKIEKLIRLSEDIKTRQYFEIIKQSVLEGKPKKEIIDLCCLEEQYFLDSFLGELKGLNFIDGGAYTGDTIREALERKIGLAKIYCFEADNDNFNKLQNYVKSCSSLQCNDCVCEHYALWDSCAMIGMRRSGYNACVDIAGKKAVVPTITIDKYFENIHIGFVKMDIEGAERRALEGGMNVLKRDRPLLAISIYHSLDDIIEIPQILMQQLPDYHFMVRSHSNTYSEAVLYGVPNESKIQLR